MKAGQAVLYATSIGFGGVAALTFVQFRPTTVEAHGHEHYDHEEALSTQVLPEGAPLHEYVRDLAEQLETGSVRLQSILDTTVLILDSVQRDLRESTEEIRLPIVWNAHTFGHLRIPGELPDGQAQWVFELTVPALSRYGTMARFSDLSITYRGINGSITLASAIIETPLHMCRSTIERLGADPFVVGGGFVVDANSSTWQCFTKRVEVPERTGIPLWTSGQLPPEPREETLGAADSTFVAAALFSL